MERNAEFIKAQEALTHMSDSELAMAGAVVKLMGEEASKHDNPKTKAIAVEMVGMFGEVTKEMVRRIVARDGMAPQNLTLEEALAKVEAETEENIAELEAA